MRYAAAGVLLLTSALSACAPSKNEPPSQQEPVPALTSLGPDERLVTVLQTNDIHGGVEAGQTD
jgi:hypothetical protein